MKINQEEYEDCFEGYQIADCVVRSKSYFYFVVREDYTLRDDWNEGDEPPQDGELKHQVVVYARALPREEQWGCLELNGFAYLLAGASVDPVEQFVGVDMMGSVYVLGSGEQGIEKDIPDWDGGGVCRGGIVKSKLISQKIYVCGGHRSVGRRDAKENWFSHTKDIPHQKGLRPGQEGFEDIDGFDEKDIYCVGGKGDVWHFNGKEWLQIHFPSNIDLYTVCCAGDGFVYISGFGGTTFKGRDDKWERIFEDNLSIPFRDMVWYEDKVWCTNEYGFWTIEKDKLQDADVDSSVLVCAGNLSVADNVMLLAGYEGIAYHENGEWHKIL